MPLPLLLCTRMVAYASGNGTKTPRNELIAECVAFGRAIGTQAERATA